MLQVSIDPTVQLREIDVQVDSGWSGSLLEQGLGTGGIRSCCCGPAAEAFIGGCESCGDLSYSVFDTRCVRVEGAQMHLSIEVQPSAAKVG